ncbi:hypothetical protein L6452_22492 [Arctium lappa]|uniref:Uncharacterized protein n=1 Tax=Arctium lappa TaxID=4217 RepID=A0ACB9B0Q8_ARCLA|nr:hypothetical protein L6452_22492 [Arctium lappa]
MKEVGRSVHSGDVVKRKSSSGCLIIKKKVADGLGGVEGFSDSASRNLFNPKEKKRPRVVRSDSESSDSEPYPRKVDKFHNGSIFSNRGFMENREFETEKRVNNGIDVFEFDDYDGFHERRIRKDVHDHRHGLKLHWQNGDRKESGSGSSRRVNDNRRDAFRDNRSTIMGAKSSRPTHGTKSWYEMEDDESHLPISVSSEKYHEVSDVREPIRLQGKNGVLKVMVNKHKQMGVSRQTYDPAEVEAWKESRPAVLKKKQLNVPHRSHDRWEAVDRQGSKPEDANKEKAAKGSSLYSALKHPGKPIPSKRKEKGELELTKPIFSKEMDDSDSSLPLKSSNVRQCTTARMVKSEQTPSPPTKNATAVKGKESKVKRGSGTEKQLLREKIRSMLLSAGWTIDYRPRRNRDYLDAVYINPAGTAYWSIIKAYEALQKEEEDHSQAGGDFTPLPIETLSKLTRQTRKKIEREMKKKRRDEGNSRNGKRDRVEEVSAEGAESDQQEEKLGSYMKHNRKTTKRRLEEASQDSGDDSNDNDGRETAKQDRAAKTTVGHNSHMVQGRKSRKLGRCTLLVRSSDEGKRSENNRFVPHSGKRTLLSWLIDSSTVQNSEKVQYMNRRKTRVMLEGWITKDGIHCGCCSKILTVSKFELHAGSKLRQPFPNIFVQSGQSLMQCQIDAWNKQEEFELKGFHTVDVDGDDPNDDTCSLCGDGGDLICCDGCPSTFHQSCLGIQMLPQGDWHCPNCSCKYCEMASTNCAGANVRTRSPLLICCLCEKKYHESCSLEMDEKPIDPTDPNLSFCGQKCLELYSNLQKLLGVKHELDSGFSWSLIRRSDLSSDTSSIELPQRVECNSKLAVALSVIDECFLPIVDRRSGIKLIHNVVYNCGSNFSRLNYSGFFTAILERGDEMICAASIRIHGTQLAEMPFIGTRHIYRRQGMCRRLLSAIESVLSSLHIEKLIIPAIAEHMHTWTGVFGFNPLKESHKQEMRSMNMLVFPGTDMLQKSLVQQSTPVVGNTISDKDKRRVEVEGSMPKAEKSEPSSPDVKEFSEKIAPTDSGSEDPTVPLDDGCSVDASDATLSIASVKDDIPLPSLARKSEIVCGSAAQFDGSSHIRCEPEIQSVFLNARSDANSFPLQDHDFVLRDAETSDNPLLAKESVSGSKVEEFVAKTTDAGLFQSQVQAVPSSDVSCDSKLQHLGKESISVEEIAFKNGIQVPVVPSGKESVVLDSDSNVDGKTADAVSSDIHCESAQRFSGLESVPHLAATNIAELRCDAVKPAVDFSTGKGASYIETEK